MFVDSGNDEEGKKDQGMQQFMSLIIIAFQSSKPIFIRDLISNLSNALDESKNVSITDPEKIEVQPNFFIKFIPDKTHSTIADSGVGMTKNGENSKAGSLWR